MDIYVISIILNIKKRYRYCENIQEKFTQTTILLLFLKIISTQIKS